MDDRDDQGEDDRGAPSDRLPADDMVGTAVDPPATATEECQAPKTVRAALADRWDGCCGFARGGMFFG